MLAPMPWELLRCVVDGTFPKKAARIQTDTWYALESEKRKVRSDVKQPAAYINYIADESGVCPSTRQWLHVLDCIERYEGDTLESTELALETDAYRPRIYWPKKLTRDGFRKYLDCEHANPPFPAVWSKNEDRRRRLRKFVKAARDRLSLSTGRDDTEPLPYTTIHVEFSVDVEERLNDHRNHRDSNFIMNLVEAVFARCYPGAKILQQKVLYACWHEMQSWWAEVVFTHVGQGFIHDEDFGFAYHPAGTAATNDDGARLGGDFWRSYCEAMEKSPEHLQRLRKVVSEAKSFQASEALKKPKVPERREQEIANARTVIAYIDLAIGVMKGIIEDTKNRPPG